MYVIMLKNDSFHMFRDIRLYEVVSSIMYKLACEYSEDSNQSWPN